MSSERNTVRTAGRSGTEEEDDGQMEGSIVADRAVLLSDLKDATSVAEESINVDGVVRTMAQMSRYLASWVYRKDCSAINQ